MKRLLAVFALLLAFSGSAWAGWVEIGSGGDGSVIHYADPNTIRKNGSMVKMWELQDLVNAQVSQSSGKTYFSSKAQREHDCQDERTRILALSQHSGKMGRRDVIYSHADPSQWSPVPPGSILESLWKFACGK